MDSSKELFERILLSASVKKMKSGDVRVASHKFLNDFSLEHGNARGEVDREVMLQGYIPERYSRNLSAITIDEQEMICSARVAQVGLGGLGGHVLELLARAGVGNIKACDGDIFEASNLNRQLLCTENTLGAKKAAAAAQRVKEINPSIRFEVESEFLKGDDFSNFVSGADVVVDCLGGLEFRDDLKKAAEKAAIPMVTASVAGWTGMVATVMPGQVSPLDFLGKEEGLENELGTQGPGIALAAGVQCAEVLKILTGKRPGLDGKALLFDLIKMYFDIVKF